MTRKLGYTYVMLTAGVIIFQFAAILGAPVGAFTQGGQQNGALDLAGRISAAVSIVVLWLLAAVIALKTGIWKSETGSKLARIAFWVVFAINLIEFVLNWITPSQSERMVWGPVNTILFGCVVGIAVLSERR